MRTQLTPQCQAVVDYVNQHGSINSIQAIRHLGITRLAARIYDLKDTMHAMKPQEDHNSAPGFVKYVPDMKVRTANAVFDAEVRMDFAMARGVPAEIANACVKVAAQMHELQAQEQLFR